MKSLIFLILSVSFLTASVDINHASLKELTSFKGIDNKKAEAIVAYRKMHCFKSVNEIIKVKGIGKKFLEKHQKELKVTSCKK